MYIAAAKLKLPNRVAQPGDEVPEAFGWSAAVVGTSLRAGTLIFVPPQMLTIPGAEITKARR